MIECPECGSVVRGKKCSCGYVIRNAPTSVGTRSVGCAANGCPLPGSISQSAYASENGSWFCRFHFGEPPEKWPQITASIRSGAALRSEELAREDHGKYLREQFGVAEK